MSGSRRPCGEGAARAWCSSICDMPVFQLSRRLEFPPPALAEEGLLAVGGDLSVNRLLLAYSLGIFPWFSEGEPILWWSPDPRMVITPGTLRVSRRLARTLRQGKFRFTVDTHFPEVIRACAEASRPDQDGTWIVPAMQEAYVALHHAGFAHSFEVWQGKDLAGGLYGVSLGAAFFGESMFSRVADASKAALVRLVQACVARGIGLIDCQMSTPHLQSMGGVELPRPEFLDRLRGAIAAPTHRGRWEEED